MEKCHDLGTVLVAGGAGWVGSVLIRALDMRAVELGVAKVVVADPCVRQWRSENSVVLEAIPLDISDFEAVESAFLHVCPDTVLNLAAVIDMRPEGNITRMEAVNDVGAGILLDAAARHSIRTYVHVSTLDVSFARHPMTLHVPDPPHDLQIESTLAYVRTKARGEARAAAAARSDAGLNVVIIRPAHIFGELVQKDPIAEYLRTVPPLRIGNPAVRMSMVSVNTVVEAIVRAAAQSKKLRGQTYALKDFDANFIEFYQERILSRRLWPFPRIPAWLALLAAHAADRWFLAVASVRRLCCRRPSFNDRSGMLWSFLLRWTSPLLDRHPMQCFCAEGIRQALVDLTVNGAKASQDFGLL